MFNEAAELFYDINLLLLLHYSKTGLIFVDEEQFT